jgi:5-methylcytosine-specific restriction protein B
MPMYYLSTETIEQAYNSVTSLMLDEQGANAVFYYLILKACGINRVSYELPNFSEKNGLYYASRLSSLFSPYEKQPQKYGFLNPFTMSEWPSQPISEPLKNWVRTRLKNNICGGGMQWRNFIDMDTHSSEITIKFKYDYVHWLKSTALDSKTINLYSLAIWSNRFTEFKQKITVQELIDEFIKTYKIDVDEKSELFNSKQDFELEFSDKMHDVAHIRSLIGNAPNGEWEASKLSTGINSYVLGKYEFDVKPYVTQKVSVDLIRGLINEYHQLILAGPPGTSKSYYAKEISKEYDKVVHVQFHPQYNYQNFVGGYIVDGTEVKYKPGVILQILDEKTYSPEKKYLIIIDEFNRANVSQVLGEIVQCLDRNQSVDIEVDGEIHNISLPQNIDIIATLNTTDRTLGTVDYAVKRRFLYVYCASNPNLLIDLCPSSNFISLCDFLTKLNTRLERTTGNRDYVIGHAVFLNEHVAYNNKYMWNFEEFRLLYNYKILPMIEDYCSNNSDMVKDVVGIKLSTQLDDKDFVQALMEFMEI